LLCVLSGLFYARYQSQARIQAHINVDRYFTAIHQLNTSLAANLLSSELFDKTYFSQRLQEEMSSDMLCSAIESASEIGYGDKKSILWRGIEENLLKKDSIVRPTEKLLFLVLKYRRLEVASELLKKGVVGNAIHADTTPLILACQAVITESSDNFHGDYVGDYRNGEKNCEDFFDLLMQHKVNVNYMTGRGNTALRTLVIGGTPKSLNCIKKLIQNNVDINQGDKEGITPLSIAAITGNIEVVKLLLKAKANPNTIRYMNHEKISLLSWVQSEERKPSPRKKRERFREIAILLKQYGAK
jgi:hypothetical protein